MTKEYKAKHIGDFKKFVKIILMSGAKAKDMIDAIESIRKIFGF